jgi:uncharacterized RDD family membrane protein YckC
MFHRCYARTVRGIGTGLAPSACQTGPGHGSVTLLSGYRGRVSNQQAASQQATAAEQFYPGRGFGLPEFGHGSVAGWSRRLGALLIDWIACSLIAILFFYHSTGAHATNVFVEPRLWTPVVFAVEDVLLTALTGFTIGKRLLGIRVVRLDGRPIGLRAVPRTLLLMLVVPPLMMDRDLRGLQDKAAGTVVIRF